MKLSNKELELKLRDLGYRPHINHYRAIEQSYAEVAEYGESCIQSLNDIRKSHKQDWIVAKGGITYCKLIADNGEVVVTTTAVCSPKDNYNKKIGIHIAMVRALAAIENGIQQEIPFEPD